MGGSWGGWVGGWGWGGGGRVGGGWWVVTASPTYDSSVPDMNYNIILAAGRNASGREKLSLYIMEGQVPVDIKNWNSGFEYLRSKVT